MTSRRRGANTVNPSSEPARTYELRGRKKNVQSEADPQTPEPEKKDLSVEQNVKYRTTRRNPEPVKPEAENSSDDGSDSSSSSENILPEKDRPSHSNRTISASKNDLSSSLLRRPIHPADDDDEKGTRTLRSNTGSAIKKSSTHRQESDFTNDDEGSRYSKEENWRGDESSRYPKEENLRDSTKIPQSQSRPEDDEELDQYQQKLKGSAIKQSSTTRLITDFTKDQLNVSAGYKEAKGTWSDRGTQSFLHYRSPGIPTGNKKSLIVQSHIGFSDDDEVITPLQQKRASQPRSVVREKINHYPEKSVQQKANTVEKPLTKSFIHVVGTCMKYLVPAFLVLLIGTMVGLYIAPMSLLKWTGQVKFIDEPQVKKDLTEDFKNLTSAFPNQSPLMWSRSRRVLDLHLESWKKNTEPAIILLTGALDAEQTLLCLGTRLADIYSSSLNGSSIVISGSDWTSGSNEEVKEYIDDRLTESFETTARAAVLHRLELLPAGSLLILYKYCDHESAVFKDVTLLLTVLLDDATLAKDISLTDLEEKVRAFLIQKLIESNPGTSHDGMDKDKFSGVWSRISHVVLPVFPETNMGECVKKAN